MKPGPKYVFPILLLFGLTACEGLRIYLEARSERIAPYEELASQGVDVAQARFLFDDFHTLSTETLTTDAIIVSTLAADGTDKWNPAAIKTIAWDATKKTVTVTLKAAVAANTLVRMLVRGTGPTPVMGTNLAPLGGGDFVYTTRRN